MSNDYTDGYIKVGENFDLLKQEEVATVKIIEDLGRRKKVEYLDQTGKVVQKIVHESLIFSQEVIDQERSKVKEFVAKHNRALEVVEKINAIMVDKGIEGKSFVANGQIQIALSNWDADQILNLFETN